MKLFRALVFVGLVFFSRPVVAQQFDPNKANDFFERCSMSALEKSQGDVWGVCNGFVDGLVSRERVALREKAYCTNLGQTRLDYYVTLEAYLKSHPNERHLSTALLALKAFSAAYPCPQKRVKK